MEGQGLWRLGGACAMLACALSVAALPNELIVKCGVTAFAKGGMQK